MCVPVLARLVRVQTAWEVSRLAVLARVMGVRAQGENFPRCGKFPDPPSHSIKKRR